MTIVDCQVIVLPDENAERAREICDDLLKQLRKSVQLTCKHVGAEITSTSESGSNTTYVGYYCGTCKKSWTDEVTNAVYLRLLEDDYTPEVENHSSQEVA